MQHAANSSEWWNKYVRFLSLGNDVVGVCDIENR